MSTHDLSVWDIGWNKCKYDWGTGLPLPRRVVVRCDSITNCKDIDGRMWFNFSRKKNVWDVCTCSCTWLGYLISGYMYFVRWRSSILKCPKPPLAWIEWSQPDLYRHWTYSLNKIRTRNARKWFQMNRLQTLPSVGRLITLFSKLWRALFHSSWYHNAVVK